MPGPRRLQKVFDVSSEFGDAGVLDDPSLIEQWFGFSGKADGLDEADGKGRTPAYGKVAAVCVVGNEDGAHHVSAELFQALADVGFTIAAGGPSYWVGEAMGSVDYKDLKEQPEVVATATSMLVKNAIHLADLLKRAPYPGYK